MTVAARDAEIKSLKITQELQKKEEKKMKEQISIYQVGEKFGMRLAWASNGGNVILYCTVYLYQLKQG